MENQFSSLFWSAPQDLSDFCGADLNVNNNHFQNSRFEYILENQKQCLNSDLNPLTSQEIDLCSIDTDWNYHSRSGEREMLNLFNIPVDGNNLKLKQSEELSRNGYKSRKK